MEFILGWIVFSIVAGVIAHNKGRSGIGYFFLSIILSPIVGIVVAALIDKKGKTITKGNGSFGRADKVPLLCGTYKKGS